MSNHRLTWDQYFMLNAHLISMRSTCNRLNVGSVLVKNNRIISTGYNGGISGDDHCLDAGCYVVDNHCLRCLHAEENAILQCALEGVSTKGSQIYVTHFPCIHCMKKILQAGITKIYYTHDYKNHEYCYHLLRISNVEAIKLEMDIENELNNKNDSSGRLSWNFQE
ncbi:ComE operon protein 2 [Robertmurraya korlensis]|uniref:ComE operon protein 2 n=1 Tax=Robertmurraya korlensis TaxID=519977 RepID=UPI00203C0B00|nr:ComE operon protein 2 [Robertmurraya korlensis]MCM3599507.1 ComE operon protein 2 [Robertmurraya korlensis]